MRYNIRMTPDPANPIRDAALSYHQRGWSILPVNSGGNWDKQPHQVLKDTGHNREEDGKVKASWKPLQTKQATEEDVKKWFERPNGKGIALVTGLLSGVVILDFDGEQGKALVEQLGLHPHVQTGSGGFHVYFKHPGFPVQTLNSKAKHELGQRWPGLDIRADGGYAVLPPSVNNSGSYKQLRPLDQLEDVSTLQGDLAEFLGLIRTARPASQTDPPEKSNLTFSGQNRVSADLLIDRALQQVQADGRNNAGMWLACQLRDNRYAEGEALQVMEAYALRAPTTNTKGQAEPYTRDAARATLRSAYSQPARDPWTPAKRLVDNGAAISSDSELRAAAPTDQAVPVLPDVGDVYVLPAPLVAALVPFLVQQQPGYTLHTQQQLTAEYLADLRRDHRAVFVLKAGPEFTKCLDRAGVEWHAIKVPLDDISSSAELVAALEAGAATAVEAHIQGDVPFLLEELPALLNARQQQKGTLYPVGFEPLDTALGGGFYPGLHVLGGVTAGGKTALALHIAEQNARAGRPVLFVTFEQSRAELWTRLISPRVGIGLGRFRAGASENMPLGDQLLTKEAYLDLANEIAPYLRVFEGDGSSGAQQWGVDRISAEVRRLRAVFGQSPLVILDYLQRMPSDLDSDKRHKVDDVVMSLQVRLGREENTPILLLSSVSRGNYGELLTRPLDERLAVFKESGGIEYTAYSATLIYPLSAQNVMQLGLPFAPIPGSPSAALQGSWRYVVLDLVKNREGEAGLQLAVKWWPGSGRYEVIKSLDVSELVGDSTPTKRFGR